MAPRNGGMLLLDAASDGGIAIWDSYYPTEFQDLDWTCSAASLAWMMSAIGRRTSESGALIMLAGRINSRLGLLDGSGKGIVEVLAGAGIDADAFPVDWESITKLAGITPIIMGGGAWNHWTGVRRYDPATRQLHLANPSPGYRQVYQSMDKTQFNRLGPFNAVVLDSWL